MSYETDWALAQQAQKLSRDVGQLNNAIRDAEARRYEHEVDRLRRIRNQCAAHLDVHEASPGR